MPDRTQPQGFDYFLAIVFSFALGQLLSWSNCIGITAPPYFLTFVLSVAFVVYGIAHYYTGGRLRNYHLFVAALAMYLGNSNTIPKVSDLLALAHQIKSFA